VSDLPGEILAFWFADKPEDQPASPERLHFWFSGGESADRVIRERFAAAVDRAAAGGYAGWTLTPRGTLALLLLLDQFPRNIFRHSPRAYSSDARALQVALDGLAACQDQRLAIAQRAFFYLPLEHAEDLAMQDRSVTLFGALRASAPPPLQPMCSGFLDYAQRHRDIIARFGRFPHRNSVLGRSSSAEEEAFLRQPGSSF
jgi:uncharacterized protein (DUF924 family)